MGVYLIVSFRRAGEFLGFDTYYIDSQGRRAGAFLNRK